MKRSSNPRRSRRRKASNGGEAPRRGRPPVEPAIQRQRLLDAARRALQKSDFGSVRVSDVVRSAGMSSRTFYDHFASKEDVLVELMEQAGSELLSQIDAIFALPDDSACVDRFLDAYLGACTSTPLDIDSLGEGLTSRVQQSLRQGVRHVAVKIAQALERRADAASSARPAVDSSAIEVVLLGLLGLASRFVHERRVDELEYMRPALRALLLRVWT